MSESLPEIYLARHGETAWTLSHQHTGRTDIPLTERGERNARSLGERLRGMTFTKVLTSSLERARRTAELAGFGNVADCRSRPDGVGLRPLRRQDDRRDPRGEPELVALSRRLSRRRVGRRGRGPGRPRHRPTAGLERPRSPLRSWPLLPGFGRSLARAASG